MVVMSGASENDVAIPSSGEEERLRFRSDVEEEHLEQEDREKLKSMRVESRKKVFFEIVKLLVENGADTSQEGGLRNELPIEIAKREGHWEIAQFLSSHHHNNNTTTSKNNRRTINLEALIDGSRPGGIAGDVEMKTEMKDGIRQRIPESSTSSSSSDDDSDSSYSFDDDDDDDEEEMKIRDGDTTSKKILKQL